MAPLEPPVPAVATGPCDPSFGGDVHGRGLGETPRINQKTSTSGDWKRAVGLALLGLVIFLWTLTNFLASNIMADDTYSKPYFITYINTSFFILPLIPALGFKAYQHPEEMRRWKEEWLFKRRGRYSLLRQEEGDGASDPGSPGIHSVRRESIVSAKDATSLSSCADPLTFRETAKLSLEFCILWFLANYFVAACLQYTTVASSTILTSTSPLFTLIFGAIFRVESLTIRKVIGVLASLAGVILISTIDLSGENSDDQHRGKFPQKSVQELALGDSLALLSAVLYGLYSVFMKKRIANEDRVDMIVFMGLVGVINVLILWPGMVIFHFTGLETFELPGTGRVVGIILANGIGSMVSDYAWAYAVLFTSPILVTVGLTMTIPLSLVGQVILNDQKASILYWIGALVVVCSFFIVFVNDKAEQERLELRDSDESMTTEHFP